MQVLSNMATLFILNPENRLSKREKVNEKTMTLTSSFQLDGVEDLYEIIQPLCERPYGREFYIIDPDGYILAFLQA
jgi:hypothetical protein